MWTDPADPLRGGQWVRGGLGGERTTVSLADVVAADGGRLEEHIGTHVGAVRRVLSAAVELEDDLFPDPMTRLSSTFAAVEANEPELSAERFAGRRARLAAHTLGRLSADLAEVLEARVARYAGEVSTITASKALCEAVQATWRLRRLLDPPSPPPV